MFRNEAANVNTNLGNPPNGAAPPPPKGIEINNIEDLFSYLKNSKDLKDFTKMGSDTKGFKHALHKLLMLVVSVLIPAQDARSSELRKEWVCYITGTQPLLRLACRAGGLRCHLKQDFLRFCFKTANYEGLLLLHAEQVVEILDFDRPGAET